MWFKRFIFNPMYTHSQRIELANYTMTFLFTNKLKNSIWPKRDQILVEDKDL